MKFTLLSLAAAAMVVTGPCPVQNTCAEAITPTIKVRLLNGKNGKPIKNDTPNIWFGDAVSPINPHTDSNGEVVVSVNQAQSEELQVLPNQYADCRFKGNSTAGLHVKYSLKQIITTGVVSENLCGKNRIDPIPRVLILYVRPMTFMERWRL
jgi:hypothetical protein